MHQEKMIMADLSGSLEKLMSPDRLGYYIVSGKEKRTNAISNYIYTKTVKKTIRHYEGASEPIKL